MQPFSARPLTLLAISGCLVVVTTLALYWWWADPYGSPEPQSAPQTGKLTGSASPNSTPHWVRPLTGAPTTPSAPQVAVTMPRASVPVPPPGAPLQKTAADTLRFAAVTSNDGSGGLHLYPGRNRVAFAQLGLRPGDQIIAVNGTAAAGHTWEQLLTSLPDGSNLTITVERGGQVLQIDAHPGGTAF